MSVPEAVDYYMSHEPKGEYVLVIKGKSYAEREKEEQTDFLKMDINDHLEVYIKQGIDKKDAMKLVAKDRGISKREVYSQLLENENI